MGLGGEVVVDGGGGGGGDGGGEERGVRRFGWWRCGKCV